LPVPDTPVTKQRPMVRHCPPPEPAIHLNYRLAQRGGSSGSLPGSRAPATATATATAPVWSRGTGECNLGVGAGPVRHEAGAQQECAGVTSLLRLEFQPR